MTGTGSASSRLLRGFIPATRGAISVVDGSLQPDVDIGIVTRTTTTPCPKCCGTGSVGTPCNCDYEWTPAGNAWSNPINTPIFLPACLFLDMAGFAGLNCSQYNQTGLQMLFNQSTGYGPSYTCFNLLTGNSSWTILQLYGQNSLSYHPAPHWRLHIGVPCGINITTTFEYVVDVSDFVGCGSAIMSLERISGLPSPDCPCTSYPSSVVIYSYPGDPCNCHCGCFSLYPDFPTKLYLRLFNIVTTPPLPPGTVFNAELDWPPQVPNVSTFMNLTIDGGTVWGEYRNDATVEATTAVRCSCSRVPPTNFTDITDCGFFLASNIYVKPLNVSFYLRTPFGINTLGRNCGHSAPCYFSATGLIGLLGGTTDAILSCNPIP